jgi:hypothetical protein
MKTYGGVDVQIHVFLTSALVGGERLDSRPGRFTPGIHWRGSWVGPRTGLDDVERRKIFPLPGLELRPPKSALAITETYELIHAVRFHMCSGGARLEPRLPHGLSWLSSVPPSEYRDSTLKQTTATSMYILVCVTTLSANQDDIESNDMAIVYK